MRTIKFRFWNKKDYGSNGDSFYQTANSMVDWKNAKDDLNKWINFEDENILPMQFTGLKDKNGKEIFEGDIVSFPDTETESVDVGVGTVQVAQTELNAWGFVEMKDYSFGLNVVMDTEVIEKGFTSFYEIHQNFGLDELEVIGNIWENPELLT